MRFRFNGVPLESWLLLPVIVGLFYVVFRWRKYGEDAFAWNHEYFERAGYVGGTVWVGTILSSFLLDPIHVAVLWVVLAVAGTFLMPWQWTETTLPRAALIALFAAVVGIACLPLPRAIHRSLFGTAAPTARSKPPLAGVPVSSFTLDFPPEWEEVPGQRPRLYRRKGRPQSGVFQVSLQPPPGQPPTNGPEALKQLADLLNGLGDDLKIGQQLFLRHEEAAAGHLAFARYRSPAHGLCQYWLLFSEPMVFATYTESKDENAEPEIEACHQVLKGARFVEGKPR